MNNTRNEPAFRDHYYTLGIDTDAAREMVEQTYWQRIRASRLGESDVLAQPQAIEDLDEAYRVLMTPELRSSYDAERAEAVGASAKPTGPQSERLEPPLRVMETQMPALLKPADTGAAVAADSWSLPVPFQVLAGSITVAATATFFAIRWLLF